VWVILCCKAENLKLLQPTVASLFQPATAQLRLLLSGAVFRQPGRLFLVHRSKKIIHLKFTIMKKNLLTGFTGIFLLLVTCIAAAGQIASSNAQPSEDFISPGKPVLNASIDRNNVNPRVVRNFVRSYKDVFGEKWFELKDGFVAMFNQDDMDYQVAYNKNGNWIRTIRSYGEAKLSHDLRHTIKSIYYDYDINRVQEIEKPVDPIAYIIQLVGKTDLISLRICDGEMTVLQKFNKSK
jgi:hypothetical protein